MANEELPRKGQAVSRAQLKINRANGVKYCFACEETKPFSDFANEKSRYDGLSPRCRACLKRYRDDRRAREPDWEKDRSAKRRASDGETINAQARERYHKDIEATRAKAKARRDANHDAVLESNRKWRAANREEINRKTRERRAAEKAEGKKRPPLSDKAKERKNATERERRDKDRDEYNRKSRERHAERYESDPEYKARCIASSAKYHAENPDVILAIRRNRKARKKNAGGKHSAQDLAAILEAQGGKCANPLCRKKLGKKYHVDHINPIAKGGANDRSNLQLMCAKCNQKKSAKDPIDWARDLGLLI